MATTFLLGAVFLTGSCIVSNISMQWKAPAVKKIMIKKKLSRPMLVKIIADPRRYKKAHDLIVNNH